MIIDCLSLTIPSFVSGDEAEIFALSFRALSDTPTYATLELVRRADTLIPFLELDSNCSRSRHREPFTQEIRVLTSDRITDTVTTPRRPYA